MNILIIGGSHGIGRFLADQAKDARHTVSILARNPEKISGLNPDIALFKGDIRNSSLVELAMRNQDAAVICIGIAPTWQPVTVFSEGTRNVLSAMQKNQTNMVIAVTGIGAGESRGHGGFLYDRIFKPLLLRRIYEDKDRQEDILRKSSVQWLIVRPGFLTNGRLTERYRILPELDGITAGKISRKDVAHFILQQILYPQYLRQAVLLTY